MSWKLQIALYAVAAVAGGLAVGGTGLGTAATPSGLVAAYAFGEGTGGTTADLSGNGNTATLVNARWVRDGRFGGAIVFNGTSSRVVVPDSPSLDVTAGMTLEAWVRPASFARSEPVIVKDSSSGYAWGLGVANGIATSYARTTSLATAGGNSSLKTRSWTFVAATYDGTTLRVYVNGNQTAAAPQTGSLVQSNGSLSIGGDSVLGNWFAGAIDNVRIYNRPLSATELSADRSTAVIPTATPTSTATTTTAAT